MGIYGKNQLNQMNCIGVCSPFTGRCRYSVGSQPVFSRSAKSNLVGGELVGVAEFRWSLNTMGNPETPRILPFDESPQNQ
jgi:hypothetical protein